MIRCLWGEGCLTLASSCYFTAQYIYCIRYHVWITFRDVILYGHSISTMLAEKRKVYLYYIQVSRVQREGKEENIIESAHYIHF